MILCCMEKETCWHLHFSVTTLLFLKYEFTNDKKLLAEEVYNKNKCRYRRGDNRKRKRWPCTSSSNSRKVSGRVPAPAPVPHTGVCSAHTRRLPSALSADRPPPWQSWSHPSFFALDFVFLQQQFCFLPVPFQVLENNKFFKNSSCKYPKFHFYEKKNIASKTYF